MSSQLRTHTRIFGAITIVGIVVTTTAPGCAVRHVDLTTSIDAGIAAQSVSKPSAYGCGDWIDNELNALRIDNCEGYCTSSPAKPWDIENKPTMMAATAGPWSFCGGHLGPADAIGIDFAPGCQLFFLRLDVNGVVA